MLLTRLNLPGLQTLTDKRAVRVFRAQEPGTAVSSPSRHPAACPDEAHCRSFRFVIPLCYVGARAAPVTLKFDAPHPIVTVVMEVPIAAIGR